MSYSNCFSFFVCFAFAYIKFKLFLVPFPSITNKPFYTLAIRGYESEQYEEYSGDPKNITPSNYDVCMGDDRLGMAEYVKYMYLYDGKRKMILMWQDKGDYWVLYTHVE